ncbi:MAG: regulatory protein RecX, partial [Cystobacter sp.]
DSEDATAGEVARATDACLRLLKARARSRHELLAALERKGFAEAVREQALARVAHWGYLDDGRFARDQAERLLEGGKYGPEEVRRRLESHGLSAETAGEAVATARESLAFDAERAARDVLARRGWAHRALDARERARAGRLLFSRGFSEDLIQKLLGDAVLEPSGPDD